MIIVGLGNPGAKYAGTRHNAGFIILDAIAAKFRAKDTGRAHGAATARARIAGSESLLVKPQGYMNRSGGPVMDIMTAEGATPQDLIIVHDDLDLPLGRVRIKKSGGDGGHNGVASVITAIGTDSFIRVKFGVGRPPEWQDPAEYVLTPFEKEEVEQAQAAVSEAVEAVASIIAEGADKAMNRFNKRT
jgi:PTH1 family peptidyl-tRNA hydrolase